jgi:hypothetical protein
MQKTFLRGREMREINESDGPDIILAVVAWMYAEGLLGARREADEDWMDHIQKTEPNIPALRIDRIQSAADIAVLAD